MVGAGAAGDAARLALFATNVNVNGLPTPGALSTEISAHQADTPEADGEAETGAASWGCGP